MHPFYLVRVVLICADWFILCLSFHHRDALRKERQRQLELASNGQKQLRARLQQKKGRQAEKLLGAKKHEDAMRELARRKIEQSSRKSASNRAAAGGASKLMQIPNKGIASGQKTKNKHMQDFERLKQNNKKRTGMCLVDVIYNVCLTVFSMICALVCVWVHTMPVHVGTVFLYFVSCSTEEIQRGQQKQIPRPPPGLAPSIENRYVSQTAPAYNNSNHPQYRNDRAPTTKVGGTVTRRTDNPTRRAAGGVDGPLYATTGAGKVPLTAPPMIAVTGMGGLRVLKASNQQQQGRGGGAGNSGKRR